ERDHDPAALLPEVPDGLADEVRRLEDVDAHRLLPARVPRLVGALERRLGRDRGVDDDDVDARLQRDRVVPQGARSTRLGEIAPDERGQLGRDARERLLGSGAVRAVVGDHGCAVCSERRRDRRADAARRAGHEHRLPGDAHAIPASTWMSCPVIPEARLLARKSAAFATSSDVAIRPSAVSREAAARASATGIPCSCSRRLIRVRSASVAIGPGASAFTRIPRRPRSSAAERTIPRTACLLPTYAARFGSPRHELSDPTATIAPPSRNTCAACLTVAITPRALTRKTSSHVARSSSATPDHAGTIPAAATTTSQLPTRRKASATAGSSPTSAATALQPGGNARTSASGRSST